MSGATFENDTIRKYLLGNITNESELEEIEKRFLQDESFYEEVLVEESELVQDYADGLLSAAERQNFEANYLKTEERFEKLRFAQALRSEIDEGKVSENNNIATQMQDEKGFMSFFKSLFSSPIPIAAAAVILLITIGGWFYWKQSNSYKPDPDFLASFKKAYENERPLESRIAGLEYAPINNLRGTSDNPKAVDTTQLNLAKSVALKNASLDPTAESYHALGQIYLAEKNFDAAIAELTKAVGENGSSQNAELFSDLGVAYLEKARRAKSDESGAGKLKLTAQALENFNRALKINASLPEARFNYALGLQQMGSIAEAKKAWREYLEKDSSSKWSDEARKNLERLESGEPQTKSRDETLKEFLTAYREKDDGRAWRISNLHREMIRGKLVPQQLAFSFLAASDEQEKSEFLNALKYAGALEKQNRNDPYFAEIAEFYSTAKAESYSTLLAAQQAMQTGFKECLNGNYQLSYENFHRAQTSFEQSGNVQEAMFARYWAAFAQYNQGKLTEHRQVLEELAEQCRSKNYQWFLAEIYTWLGVNAEELTEYSKAIEYHEKSVELCRRISDIYNLQKTLTILAEEYARIGQHDRSLRLLEETLALFADIPETSLRQKWRTYHVGATVLYGIKFYEAAVAFERESLEISNKNTQPDDAMFSSVASLRLGMIRAQQGRFDEAADYLEEGRRHNEAITEENPKKKYLSSTLTQQGNLARMSGNCADAMKYYETALLFGSILNKPNEYSARKGRLSCLIAENNTPEIEKEISPTLELFEKNRRLITDETSRNIFFDNEQDVYDLVINYEFGKGNYEQAFDYSETSRARSLLELLKNRNKDAEAADASRTVQPLKLREIRPLLPAYTQIVQYTVLENKVLIWLITTDNFAVTSLPVANSDLKRQINDYLNSLTNRNSSSSETTKNLSKEIYKKLIAPIRQKLDLGKEIVFVPDKFLFQVPFPALVSPDDEKYLIEDFTSFYAPSVNVFLSGSQKAEILKKERAENTLIVGNPSFDQSAYPNLPPLPDAENEAGQIARIYKDTKPLTGKSATADEFKKRFSQADIVHFAGHYIVNNFSPMRSYLLLAGQSDDSALTNDELRNEIAPPAAKLIVLSACQTGFEKYYNGEGTVGAARTFLGMGVPLVIASQWSVDSEASRDLMIKFHQYRKTQKLSSVAALRRAQLDLIRDTSSNEAYKFREPFYWAAFAPIGGDAKF